MTEREFAQQIVEQLRGQGFQALWAGGCVRDLLMGNTAHDYDVATDAKPQQIRQIFGHARTLAVGAAFGVIIVLSPDRKMQVEVATFRTDADYSDGRHPDSVTFSTPEMDAQRRDFTINGLFYDPIDCRVIDYVGGQEDLNKKVLRAIGDPEARINEDKLRMLRAVRFAARFSLEIEPRTYSAICAHSSEVAKVSGERLAIELRKTLETIRPSWATSKWADSGLLEVLLPEVAETWVQEGAKIQAMLASASTHGWLARLSCILWPMVQRELSGVIELTESLKQRLRMANDEIAAISFALSSQGRLETASRSLWSTVQPLLISPWIETAVELLSLRVAAGEVADSEVQWLRQALSWPKEKLNPALLVTGQELIQNGLKPGPKFKDLLQQVRDQQLDGILVDTAQAIEFVRRSISNR
ncbi:MAG: CCA tRNA nucleotidyltransferase [Pirellulales bacterium]